MSLSLPLSPTPLVSVSIWSCLHECITFNRTLFPVLSQAVPGLFGVPEGGGKVEQNKGGYFSGVFWPATTSYFLSQQRCQERACTFHVSQRPVRQDCFSACEAVGGGGGGGAVESGGRGLVLPALHHRFGEGNYGSCHNVAAVCF